VGFVRDSRGIFHGGVLAFASHIDSIGTECGFVNEGRAFVCQLNGSLGELRIQAIHEGLSLAGKAKHHVRRNGPAIWERYRLAVLELSIQRPARDFQFFRTFQIEDAGFVFFLESPAEAENRVIERKRVDVKLILIEDTSAVPAREFLNRQLESELKVGSAERGVQENTQTFRPEHVQWRLASIKMKCAEQAGDAVQVIAVKMANKDRMDATALDARSHQLQLRSFAAVEQKHIAFAD